MAPKQIQYDESKSQVVLEKTRRVEVETLMETDSKDFRVLSIKKDS